MNVARYLSFYFLVLVASRTLADPLLVLGGEHDTFTRLVIYQQDPKPFNIVQSDGLVEVNISGHGDGFRLERSLARLSRNRISDIRETAGKLEVELGCNCTAAVSEQDSLIVLDIKEVSRESLVEVNGVLGSKPEANGRVEGSSYTALLPIVFTRDDSEVIVKAAHFENYTDTISTALRNEERFLSIAGFTPEVDDAEIYRNQNSTTRIDIQSDIVDQSIKSEKNIGNYPSGALNNIRTFESNIGRLARESESKSLVCPPKEVLSIDVNKEYEDTALAISALWREKVNALGQTDEKVVEEIARSYLGIGFGHEAFAITQTISDKAVSKAYKFIAKLIMNKPNTTPPSGWRWQKCDYLAHLWFMISDSDFENISKSDVELALRQYSSLSWQLRNILHSRISSRTWVVQDEATVFQIEQMQNRSVESTVFLNNVQGEDSRYKSIESRAVAKIDDGYLSFSSNANLSSSELELIRYFSYVARDTIASEYLFKAKVILFFSDRQYRKLADLFIETFKSEETLVSSALKVIVERLSSESDDVNFLLGLEAMMEPIQGYSAADDKLKLASRARLLNFDRLAANLLAKIPGEISSSDIDASNPSQIVQGGMAVSGVFSNNDISTEFSELDNSLPGLVQRSAELVSVAQSIFSE